jgi:ribose-phosphate pyrophosphokinase
MNEERLIFAGRSATEFAADVASRLGTEVSKCMITDFPDGETSVKIEVNVRGRFVFVIQSMCPPVNQNLVELLIMLDAFKRASAWRTCAVIPYYGYARQDRKDQPRVPITAKLVAELLTTAGADRVLTMDLHAGQIQGFFDVPVDNLTAQPIFLKAIYERALDDITIASPDIGGVKPARHFALALEKLAAENGKPIVTHFAVVDKQRKSADDVQAMGIVGDVKGRNVVIVDDMVSTAGSLVEAAGYIMSEGAKSVRAAITHPLLIGDSVKRIKNSPIEELLVTDTIPVPPEKLIDKITLCPVTGLFADAIDAIYGNKSVSKLFTVSR